MATERKLLGDLAHLRREAREGKKFEKKKMVLVDCFELTVDRRYDENDRKKKRRRPYLARPIQRRKAAKSRTTGLRVPRMRVPGGGPNHVTGGGPDGSHGDGAIARNVLCRPAG